MPYVATSKPISTDLKEQLKARVHRDRDVPDDEDSLSYPREVLSSPHDQEPVIKNKAKMAFIHKDASNNERFLFNLTSHALLKRKSLPHFGLVFSSGTSKK